MGEKSTYLWFLGLILLLFGLLVDDVHQAIFQGFFVLCQPVLLPGVIEDGRIETVTFHAALEE